MGNDCRRYSCPYKQSASRKDYFKIVKCKLGGSMFKFEVTLDQHDLIGTLIIVLGFICRAFNVIDNITLLGALGVASGLILGSNVPLLSGKPTC